MARRTHRNGQASMPGRSANRPDARKSNAPASHQKEGYTAFDRQPSRAMANPARESASSAAYRERQSPNAARAQAANPSGSAHARRLHSEAGHAPIYDQDAGRLGRPIAPPAENAARRQKKARRRLTQAEMRRRKLRRRLATALLILTVIAAGIVLTVVLLFKVNKFEVQNLDGTTPADTGVYTEDQIVSALGIETGTNLFSFHAADKVAALNTAFPLLENVEVRRRLPDAVIVRVQPAVESYCIQTDTGWAVLSRHLKVISVVGDAPELPVLAGAVSAAPQQGQALVLDTPETETALNQLLDALDAAGLGQEITQIDFQDMAEVSFLYQGRIRIKLGTINSLDYKLKWTAYIVLNQNGDGCSASDTGVLDVSHLRSDGTIRPTFAQGDPNAEPTPAPQPAASDSAASAAASTSASEPLPDAQPAA